MRLLFMFVRLVEALLHPTLAAAIVGWIAGRTALADTNSLLIWAAAIPLLYAAWLITLLGIYVCDTTLRAKLLVKPRRMTTDGEPRAGWRLLAIGRLYRRADWIGSLPLIRGFLQTPLLRAMVLRAYAPSATVGERVVLFGELLDPDLTRIGDDAVVGAGARVVAHTMTRVPGGRIAYRSAPIQIGDRAVIGGESFVGMGAKIGADALVELKSFVPPFSVIPAGEIWGGHPAVFRRRKEGVAETGSVERVDRASPADLDGELRRTVADALGLPPDRTGELDVASCAEWDSLGQMAIAAAVFDRYGVEIPQRDLFSIRSLEQLAGLVGGATVASSPPPEPTIPDDPELLPLGDPESVTRELARRGLPAPPHEMRVCVASSFVAQPVANTARLWGRAFGLELELCFQDYGQVVQALTADDSLFRSNTGGLNVVLVRPEDIPGAGEEQRRAALDQLLDAILAFGETRALTVGSLPPVVSAHSRIVPQEVDGLRVRWSSRLSGARGVELLDLAAVVERIGTREAGNAEMESVARAPYSSRLYQELGIELVREVRRSSGLFPPAKLIAVDCDGTLWGGVLGEDGPQGLVLGDDGAGRGFRLFQRSLLALKERGALLAVVSRNEPSEVWQLFDEHPEMVLRRDDIAASRIRWSDKSESLREIADELNLGLDSVVFLDDDPAVRLEVKARAPEVTVVPLPEQPERYAGTLSRLWIFDGAPATAEDRSRTRMMLAEQARQRVRESGTRLEDYLAQLQLIVDFRPVEERDMPRAAQLTQKTNQFNLSLRRRTLGELQALGPRTEIFVLGARDRYGDYGSVGVAILAPGSDDSAVEFDTLLLSCRALGRGIEEAFLARLAQVARARGASRIEAPFVRGPRNRPVLEFMERSGFVETRSGVLGRAIDDGISVPAHIGWVRERVTAS